MSNKIILILILLVFIGDFRMCLDITKYIDTIKKKELDTFDHITRVISSYDINELVTYIEF